MVAEKRTVGYYVRLYLKSKSGMNWVEGNRKKLLDIGESLFGSFDIDEPTARDRLNGTHMSEGDKIILINYVKAAQVVDIIETAVSERMTAQAELSADLFLNGMKNKDVADKYGLSTDWIAKVKRKGYEAIQDEINCRKGAGISLSSDIA